MKMNNMVIAANTLIRSRKK